MSNDLVPSGGNYLALAADDIDLLMGTTSDMGSNVGVFLKHNGNSGEYTYGSGDDELVEGSELVVDFTSLKRGWICWQEEKVVGEVMRSYREGPPPAKHTLDMTMGPFEDGDGWSEQVILVFKMVTAPFTELTFKASSMSKINALGRLLRDYGAQAKLNPGKLPIVELGNQEFESKAKGAKKAKKFAPVFKIVAWDSPEALIGAQEGSEEDYAENEAIEGPEAEEEELVQAPAEAAPPATRTRAARAEATAAAAPSRRGAAAEPARPARRASF